MVLGKKHGTGYLPYTCVKSHLNDKPTCCLPLRPQSRHSNLWYFGAQLLSLQPCCLRLAHYIAVIHSRLTSNAVVSSLFDRISTCRIARPLLDARSGTRYSHSTPFDIIWTFVHTLLTVPDPRDSSRTSLSGTIAAIHLAHGLEFLRYCFHGLWLYLSYCC